MPYKDFSELVLHEQRDQSFEISIIDRNEQITMAAVHGGPIEVLTDLLAELAAGKICNYYVFKATDPTKAESFRIPVTRFNELRLKNLMERSRTTVHIDGIPGSALYVGLGTPDENLQAAMTTSLQEAGFEVGGLWHPADVYGGYHFFSHGRDANVQIELSTALRETLVEGGDDGRFMLNERAQALASAILSGARTYLINRDMDLTRTMAWFDETTDQVKKAILTDGGDQHHHHEHA